MVNQGCGSWVVEGVRIVDPGAGRDELADLFISDGEMTDSAPKGNGFDRISGAGLVAVPSFIDVHVHFREPGGEQSETLVSGVASAVAGGFGTVLMMPNTSPPIDTAARVVMLRRAAESCNNAELLVAACISSGRKGKILADLDGMAAAGASAFTDDGSTSEGDELLEQAMTRAAALGLPLLDHALLASMAGEGVMHEGPCAARHGLPGIPAEAELAAVRRDIRLAQATGARVHIQHVSCAKSVDLVRQALRMGVGVSCEACPHHLALTEEDVDPANANYKMSPPLRSVADRQAIRLGVADGTISCLATDHAPHHRALKEKGFIGGPFGVVGLEIAVGISYCELVCSGLMTTVEWVRRWTTGPASLLGRAAPGLRPGYAANIVLLDLESEWVVVAEKFLSLSRNTPFGGRRIVGRPAYVFRNGRLVWTRNNP